MTDAAPATTGAGTGTAEPILAVEGLTAGYGPVAVLHGLDFHVGDGEIVVILGSNGAGKTTTLRAVSGMIPSKGSIRFAGVATGRKRPDQLVAAGMAHVPQGRGTITDLTVEENLRIGAFRRSDDEIADDIARWFDVFPRLGERRTQPAGSMSGGEQQMLAVVRALMSRPRLVLLDEPSLGLAPLITREVFDQLEAINRDTGVSVLVVEQNANLALAVAHRGYVLETGRLVAQGPADELAADESIRKAYLGY